MVDYCGMGHSSVTYASQTFPSLAVDMKLFIHIHIHIHIHRFSVAIHGFHIHRPQMPTPYTRRPMH